MECQLEQYMNDDDDDDDDKYYGNTNYYNYCDGGDDCDDEVYDDYCISLHQNSYSLISHVQHEDNHSVQEGI